MTKEAGTELATAEQRRQAWLDMLFADHGFLRVFWTARHPVAPDIFRSNQPLPRHLRWAKRRGIKTVVNLRGSWRNASLALEEEACRRLGLKLVNFQVRSRDMPERQLIFAARDLFRTVEYPVLMHCKSGADRVGFMSVLYLILEKNEPVERALRHLSWRYGHVRQAKTGLLDHFFEAYRDLNRKTPMSFLDWVDKVYDREALKAQFMSRWWANVLVDRVLKHE